MSVPLSIEALKCLASLQFVMLLPWGLHFVLLCKTFFLDLIPHHLEICLNVTFLIRSFSIIQYLPASLSPLPVFVYNIYNFQIDTWSVPRPHCRVSSMRAGIASFVLCFIPSPEKVPDI